MNNNIEGFINCVCTYLSIVYKECSGKDDYLDFLTDKILIEKEISIKETIVKDNPWNYQPFIIGNNIYTKQNMVEQYIKYLHEHTTLKIYWREKEDVIPILHNKDKIIIVPVDEFYVSHSKFYKKKHNNHFLMLFDYDLKKMAYVDSEYRGNGWISEEEIIKAISESMTNQRILVISIADFQLQPSKKKKVYIEPKISFVSEDYIISQFNLEALRLSIVFQIKPYILMCMRNLNFEIYEEIYELLEGLSLFLLMARIKGKVDAQIVKAFIRKVNYEIKMLNGEN